MKKLSRILLFICIAAVVYSVVAFQREMVATSTPSEGISMPKSEPISEPKIEAEEASFDTRWSELPERVEGDFLKYKTYFTTLSDSTVVRNYSICYDTHKMVSRWVAYPLHEVYTTPKIERTDAWAFDDAITTYGEGGYDIIGYELTEPVIPQYLQPNVKAGGFNDGENRKLDRGHMLPSASRYNSWQTNAQTFYATNIFPQNARLNQQNWAEVEDRARRSICADTLYVVVGTLFENPTTFHSRGRHLAWPSHCYKLLLRTRSGDTGKSIAQIDNAEDIMAIGFLFENTTEGNVEPAEAVASIAEIEARSGIKFFPTLNPSIEKAVKEQKNIADWKAFK
ncbi:MAG: DNA/RNA non-specific endonuclease [Alistipes sp.]|nr:DNA/RNA non-specific endonuclease [Alistipes sp.]